MRKLFFRGKPLPFNHKIQTSSFVILMTFPLLVLAAPSWTDFRQSMDQGKKKEAYEVLNKIKEEPKNSATALVGLGYYQFMEGKLAEAESAFLESLKTPNPLEDYAHYFLGQIYKSKGNLEEARKNFSIALQQGATDKVELDSAFELGQIAIENKKWKEAKSLWLRLERRLRSDTRYPIALWSLMSLESNLGNKFGVCRYARKLYSNHPTHTLVNAWTLDLSEAQVGGKRTGCIASKDEQRKRIRNLQWGGQPDRARQEVEVIRERIKKSEPFEADRILAQYYIQEGNIDEAMKLLLPYFETFKNNYSYLMMVGGAASRMGNISLALSSYDRAYRLTPKSKDGRTALFQSGFVAYQFQDYDGATQRFQNFLKVHGKSSMAKDVKWHLAWMEYLRGNFEGSLKRFTELSKERVRRNAKGWSQERLNYWKAMSLLRLGRTEEARNDFFKLSKDSLRGYYSVASQYRYNQIEKQFPKLARLKKDLAGGEAMISNPEDEGAIADQPSEEEAAAAEVTGEEESASPGAPDSQKTALLNDAGVKADARSPFGNPSFTQRFERAQALMQLGMMDWAKWELYEIERRTGNRDYLKKLISEYETISAYNRSSTIGQIQFGMTRAREGYKDGRKLWESTYPRAFESSIKKYSAQFSVPTELVWGIMRAESQYRKEAVSPVGALGLMQIMPHTGIQLARLVGDKTLEPGSLLESEPAIKLGSHYLSRLMKKFEGKVPLVAAAYNAGPHRVKGWLMSFGTLDMDEFIEHIPYVETRNYVKKVSANYEIYIELYNGRDGKLLGLESPTGVQIAGPFPTRETWEEI